MTGKFDGVGVVSETHDGAVARSGNRASWFRRAGVGRALYYGWHMPIGTVSRCIRDGGPFEQRRTERGRREMEEAAYSLPPLSPGTSGSPVEVHVLTGRRFWYQTAFCLWTLARHAGRTLHPVVYDDGSLLDDWRAPLRRLFPAARFVANEETVSWLDDHLPASRYPALRDRWIHYPNIRKLLDVHVGREGWKLVVDSDLLFFRRPDFLVDWLDRPALPLHAVDCETSYGYSRPLMDRLAGAPVADRVNVGLTGLDGGTLDWDRLEMWCRAVIEREGTHYYLEQALVAMLLAGQPCAVAPAGDYVTLPRAPEVERCEAVMHHYVAQSKRWYFQQNWQRAAR